MAFKIIEKDITTLDVDAIVNAANTSLLGGGGVDGAIHRAAGPELLKECKTLNGCGVGGAKITKGYELRAKYVIHTVGPVWKGGHHGEEESLRKCYQNSLKLALDYNLESIAFPLISSGVYGYPKDQASKIALEEIKRFLEDHEIDVTLVILNEGHEILSSQRKESIDRFLYNNYFDQDSLLYRRSDYENIDLEIKMPSSNLQDVYLEPSKSMRSLHDVVAQLEETFSEQLIRLIDDQGKTDVEVYKKANLDRKLFSKIKNNKNYNPSKYTAMALSIGLGLNLDETKDLLLKAGFAFSPSSRADLIITYFIQEEIYDIFEINEALFAFQEPLLGA